MKQETYNCWSFILQVITFLALVAYTFYTKKMQEAVTKQSNDLNRQVSLSILPAFTCEFEDKQQSNVQEHKFGWKVVNIGNGLATDIKISPLIIEPDEILEAV